MKNRTYIEPLEDRIAPATLVNPYTVTYQAYETDSSGNQIQGDTVQVHISKPLFTSTAAANNILGFASAPGGNVAKDAYTGNTSAEYLSVIDLLGNSAASGMNISVSIIPHAGVGNGQFGVGDINAGNFDTNTGQATGEIPLGNVYVQGALGGITCGNYFATPASLVSLTAGSLSGGSFVLGLIDSINIKGNFTGSLVVSGFQFGSIDRLTIGGMMTGDSAGDAGTGAIKYTGHIGIANIGSMVGTSGSDTGEIISAGGGIVSLHVKGSITGGSGADSGAVTMTSSGGISNLIVDGSITGGSGQNSGAITLSGAGIGKTSIGGSVTGGSGSQSGSIVAEAGNLGPMSIGGSITGGSAETTGIIAAAGSITSISVGGSVTGSTGTDSGVITANTAIGKVSILGSLTGGNAGTAADSSTSAAAVPGVTGVIEATKIGTISIAGSIVGGTPDATQMTTDGTANATADTSGAILTNSVTSIAIGGSITANGGPTNGVITGETSAISVAFGNIKVLGGLTGGAGANSGSILATGLLGGTLKSLSIGGNVTGGAGADSGEIKTSSLTSLMIGGNLTGGSVTESGDVLIGGALGTATIQGNLVGGTADTTTQILDTGYLQANKIGSLLVGGNITSGSNTGTGGTIANDGGIRSGLNIGSLTIDGSITGTAANPVIISATQGPETGTKLKTDLAIGSVTVDGAISHFDLLAGYSTDVSSSILGAPTDGAAQIGTIVFNSTLSASNIVAGAQADSNGQFGTTGVKEIIPRAGAAGVLSSIASIVVKGTAIGDSTPANAYGIDAESLGSISINGATIPTDTLTPGQPVAVSGNLFLLEPLLK